MHQKMQKSTVFPLQTIQGIVNSTEIFSENAKPSPDFERNWLLIYKGKRRERAAKETSQ